MTKCADEGCANMILFNPGGSFSVQVAELKDTLNALSVGVKEATGKGGCQGCRVEKCLVETQDHPGPACPPCRCEGGWGMGGVGRAGDSKALVQDRQDVFHEKAANTYKEDNDPSEEETPGDSNLNIGHMLAIAIYKHALIAGTH